MLITNMNAEGTFACLKAAYDAGINFFDCAENYSAGESEKVMGEAIKHFGWKRNDLVRIARGWSRNGGLIIDQVISTKLNWGNDYSDVKVNNNGLSRKHIIEGINGSLKRLQLDYGQSDEQ